MEGIEGDHPLLDCSADICVAQPVNAEVEMRVVVGMARSGVAAARLLHSRGESVFVTDSGKPRASAELDALGIPWEGGQHTAAKFLQADEIVVSPGVPLTIPPLQAARAKGVPIISELELASRYLKGRHHRNYRIQRQDDHNDTGRRDSEGGRQDSSGGREYWNGDVRAGRHLDAIHDQRD
jgi:hypothetical protein